MRIPCCRILLISTYIPHTSIAAFFSCFVFIFSSSNIIAVVGLIFRVLLVDPRDDAAGGEPLDGEIDALEDTFEDCLDRLDLDADVD